MTLLSDGKDTNSKRFKPKKLALIKSEFFISEDIKHLQKEDVAYAKFQFLNVFLEEYHVKQKSLGSAMIKAFKVSGFTNHTDLVVSISIFDAIEIAKKLTNIEELNRFESMVQHWTDLNKALEISTPKTYLFLTLIANILLNEAFLQKNSLNSVLQAVKSFAYQIPKEEHNRLKWAFFDLLRQVYGSFLVFPMLS